MKRSRRRRYDPGQRWLPLAELPALLAGVEGKGGIPVGAAFLDGKVREGKRPRKAAGRGGKLYLRLRVAQVDPALKSVCYDLPLGTRDRAVGMARARLIVLTLLRLGRRVMGDLSEFRAELLPPKPKPPPPK